MAYNMVYNTAFTETEQHNNTCYELLQHEFELPVNHNQIRLTDWYHRSCSVYVVFENNNIQKQKL